MNPFVVFKQSLPVAAIYVLQTIAPALVAVSLLIVVCGMYGQYFGQKYVLLSVLVTLFALWLVKPPSDITIRVNSSYWDALGYLGVRWGIVLGVLLFVAFTAKVSDEYSRRAITTWVIMTPFAMAAVSTLLSIWLRQLLMSPNNARAAVIAGWNDSSRRFAHLIGGSPEACMRVAGFFDDRSAERLGVDEQFPLLGPLPRLASYVQSNGISVIFIALPMRHIQRVMDLLDDLRDTTVSIYYLPDIFVYDLIQARTGEILGTPVVAMCETPFHGFRGVVKRLTDTLFASLILVSAVPVMVAIAIAIKLTSRGSILFKQRRYGLDGKEIVVYKFRTMTVSEDGDDFVQAKKGDSRINYDRRIPQANIAR